MNTDVEFFDYRKYLVLAVTYLFIDTMWIYTMSRFLYVPMVEKIQSSPLKPRFRYAFGSYVFLILAFFAICVPLKSYYDTNHPNMSESVSILLSYGLVGLIIYAVYNFTNAAIFENYPLHIVLLDSLWGGVVFFVVGVVGRIFV